MQKFGRILLATLIWAGLAAGMERHHDHAHEEDCISHCETHHPDLHESGDHEDHDKIPHQHACCHVQPAAPLFFPFQPVIAFRAIYLEYSSEHPLRPDEPVYALDKPPLIG